MKSIASPRINSAKSTTHRSEGEVAEEAKNFSSLDFLGLCEKEAASGIRVRQSSTASAEDFADPERAEEICGHRERCEVPLRATPKRDGGHSQAVDLA